MQTEKKPFTVLKKPPKMTGQTASELVEQDLDEKARESASIAAKEKKSREADKILHLIFADENVFVQFGKAFAWFSKPGLMGEPEPMFIQQFIDRDQNRHIKDLTHSIAIERFKDCWSVEEAEKLHSVSLRRSILNARGIKYAFLTKGNGPNTSLHDVPLQLEGQDGI